MTLPLSKRILRKYHSGQQTTVTPKHFASFTDPPQGKPPKTLSFGDVMRQIISSEDSFTFNKNADQICQTDDQREKCRAKAMEEEDVPLCRKKVRKSLGRRFPCCSHKTRPKPSTSHQHGSSIKMVTNQSLLRTIFL